MQAQMLAPAAVLVVWTLIVLFWIIPTRFGAIAKVEDKSVFKGGPGGRGQDLEGKIPDKANWPSHNHTHLHEGPTLFYAVSVIIAIVGAGAFDVLLAWIYVGLRCDSRFFPNVHILLKIACTIPVSSNPWRRAFDEPNFVAYLLRCEN